MKRIVICTLVVIAVFTAATTMLRSKASAVHEAAGTRAMMPVQETNAQVGGAGKLPNLDIEDRSLVFPER